MDKIGIDDRGERSRNAGYFALGVSSYNRNIGSKMMERTR